MESIIPLTVIFFLRRLLNLKMALSSNRTISTLKHSQPDSCVRSCDFLYNEPTKKSQIWFSLTKNTFVAFDNQELHNFRSMLLRGSV